MLDKQFFSNPKFTPFIQENFIAVHAVRGQELGDKLYRDYQIRATPTVLIADVDGSEIDRQVGYGPPPSKFKERLEESLTGEDTYAKLKQRYEANPDDLVTTFKLAMKYSRMYREKEKAELLKKVLDRAEEAKTLSVHSKDYDADINLYEWARYLDASGNVFSGNPVPRLKEFLQEFPESRFAPTVVSNIAMYYAYQNPSEEGYTFIKEAMEKYPENKSLKRIFLNFTERSKTHLDEAIELAEKEYKEQAIPDPYLKSTYARLLEAKEEYEKLDELYSTTTLEMQNETYAYALYDFARYWNEQDDNLDAAEQMIKLAIQLAPNRTNYRSLAAEICLKNNHLEEANRLFGPEYIATRKDKTFEVMAYVRFWSKQGENLKSALELAQALYQEAPNSRSAETLADVYWALGQKDKALEVYGDDFIKDKKNAMTFNSYAWFWAQKGANLASAEKAIRRAIDQQPLHYYWDTLALICLKAKKYDEALAAAQKALEQEPNDNTYKERLEEIKKAMGKAKK